MLASRSSSLFRKWKKFGFADSSRPKAFDKKINGNAVKTQQPGRAYLKQKA
jgi:hypothetical protein